jgi:hypothetical protein
MTVDAADVVPRPVRARADRVEPAAATGRRHASERAASDAPPWLQGEDAG